MFAAVDMTSIAEGGTAIAAQMATTREALETETG